MGSKREKSACRLLIMTIGILTRKCTNGWILSGAHTQWIDLLLVIMLRLSDSIPDMLARVQKQWMLLQ